MAATATSPIENGTAEPQAKRTNADLLEQIVSTGAIGERDRILLLRAELDYEQRLSKLFAKSGLFADVKGVSEEEAIARCFVKIALGKSMGFSAAESLQGIDVIQNRLAIGAHLRAARFQRAGFSWPGMIVRDEGCWIPLFFQNRPMLQQKVSEAGDLVFDANNEPVMVNVVVSYTRKDAERAGLWTKDNYKRMPSDMMFARAITRAQRRYGPGVLGVDVLDTYEAQDLRPEPERATLTLDALTPSQDENRGHDATAAQPEAKPEAVAGGQLPVAGEATIRTFASWPELKAEFGGEAGCDTAPSLGLAVEVGGKSYFRMTTEQTWSQRK